MSAYIDKFRELKPAFKDSTDEELIPYLHEKYASDMPISEFYKKIGVEDPNAPGDISRGYSTGMEQLKQTGYGILAAGGATAEHFLGEGGISTGIKKAGLAGYKEQEEKIAETAKPSDEITYSWEKAKEGDFGALADWMQYGIGQAGSQAVQALATAGLGGFIAKAGVQAVGKELAAKLVESQAAKIAETEATKIAAGELTKEAIEQQATKMVAEKIGNIGATTALGGLAVTQEGGEIGGDLVAKAEKEGIPLTGDQLAKAFGYSLGAGALEFVGDKFGLDVLTGKSKFGKTIGGMEGIGGRVARGTVAGLTTAPIEAGTEYGQTLLEEAGKGNDPFSEQARKNAINAAAAGAFGGHVMGMAGGMLTAPIAKATTVDDAIVNAEKALSEPTFETPATPIISSATQTPVTPTATAEEILKQQTISGLPTQESIDRQFPEPSGYRPIGILGVKHQNEVDKIEPDNRTVNIGGNDIDFRKFAIGQITSGAKPYEVAKENFNKIYNEQNQIETPVTAEQQVQPIAETKAPTAQPKPIEFTPTHQLNDGTPVIKVAGEDNVYADVSGNEWQADDAVPIVTQKQAPAVEPKTIKQAQPAESKLNLKPIPTKQGSSPIIDFNDRKIVIADVNGVNVPFYLSTGEGGKKDVKPGKWYPMFGIGEKSWINKTSGSDMNTYYGSSELAEVSKQLDNQIGDIRSDINHPVIQHIPPFQADYDKATIDFINSSFINKPAGSHNQSNAGDIVRKNIEDIKQRIVRPLKNISPIIEPTTQQPRKSIVGEKLAAGEIVSTSSGRQTTPFPKFQTKEGNIKPVHLKAVDKWLMRNAFEEAKAKGDEFNARQFEDNLDKPSQADKDSAEEYLFGEQPVVEKPLVKEKPSEMEDLKSQMGQAIGELASLLGGKTNLTEEEETKLIPIMSKIFRIAAKMGYVKFKDAAQHVMSQIRELAGDEVADKLSIENLQAGYINIAKEIGGDKREALQYESIEELEGDKNAVEKQETTQPNGSRSAQPRVREEGEDTTEGRARIRESGQEERDISQDLIDVFNKLGKQGISKSGESLIKQRSNADIITAVQNHWLDVLADVGYEKESKSDNPNGKVFIQC